MTPVDKKILEVKGVHQHMLEQYINDKVNALRDYLIKEMNQSLITLRKEILRTDKKNKRLFEILFSVKSNKLMKTKADNKERLDGRINNGKSDKKISKENYSSKAVAQDFDEVEEE
jgi:hypothetical protein